MTRKISFRAWDKEEKKMWPDMPLLLQTDWKHPTLLNLVVEDMQKRFDLMQFTGLHDRHGKEVWEGDIIEFADAYGQGGPHKASVEYLRGGFVDSEFHQYLGERKPYEIEVIGNIYES